MPGKKLAVLVGINQYERAGPLKYAVQDAELLQGVLIESERGGYDPDYVKVLSDNSKPSPIKANIQDTIANISSAATDEDEILFYFAGHGVSLEEEAYLFPNDGSMRNIHDTCISLSTLQSGFESCRARVKCLILDSCHSGLEIGRPASGLMTQSFQRKVEQISSSRGFVVLASCGANESSIEDDVLQHGIFSYYLGEGLMGKADQNQDFKISVHEAYSYVFEKVNEWCIRNNSSQTPTLMTKLAGDVVLVSMPRPMPYVQSPVLSVVMGATLRKNVTREGLGMRVPQSAFAEAQESAKQECLELIGKVGAAIAGVLGAKSITKQSELERTFPNGKYYVSIFNDGKGNEVIICGDAIVHLDAVALENEPLLDGILRRGAFDSVRYELSAPIDLARMHDIAVRLDYWINRFDPPDFLEIEKNFAFNMQFANTGAECFILCAGKEFKLQSPMPEQISLKTVTSMINETLMT